MKRFVVDANAFLRLFLNDIVKQADEVEKLFHLAQEGKVQLFVPQITIFEIAFSLDKYYHFSKQEVIDKLKSIVSAPYLTIQSKEIFRKSLKLFEQENISFVDCFIATFAKNKDFLLFTFDKDLKKLMEKNLE